MVQDAQVSGDDFILQHGAGRDVDPVPVIGYDDHRSLHKAKGSKVRNDPHDRFQQVNNSTLPDANFHYSRLQMPLFPLGLSC